jgi:hypothetical protein
VSPRVGKRQDSGGITSKTAFGCLVSDLPCHFPKILSGVFGGRNLLAPYELLANYVGPPSIHLYRNGTADLTIANALVEGLANVTISILH